MTFNEKNIHDYRYEVLRGQHSATARIELHNENPDNPLLKSALAEVYVGLSNDEALRLASRHNSNGHFIHKMSHKDYVSLTITCTYTCTFMKCCILQ